MNVEISQECVDSLNEIKKHKTHKDLTIEWMVEHAIRRYFLKKMDDFQYDTYRRKQIRKRLSYQSWMCYFCGTPLTFPGNTTLDHLTPLTRGGSSTGDNLAVCCLKCNGIKGDMTEEEFRKYLDSRKPLAIIP